MQILRIILVCIVSIAGGNAACDIAAKWRGSWFINAFRTLSTVDILQTSISARGKCIATNTQQDRYLLYKNKTEFGTVTHCYTCMVLAVRHQNILQFKEKVQCNPVNTDENLMNRICSEISGDTTLKTLVRKEAAAISCPEALQKVATLQYDKGQGLCDNQNSKITSCASNKKLQLTFGECTVDREYTNEQTEMQCLANWGTRGNWWYVKYGADQYRCLHYDVTSRIMGISADASCTGISIISGASIYLEWQEDFTTPRRATEMCSYPSWFNNKEWSDLKGEHIYRYDSVTNELVVDKQPVGSSKLQETVQRFTCEKKTSNDRYRFVTKVTNECSHGYKCVIFKKKSDTVIEMTTGAMATTAVSACSSVKRNSPSAVTKLLIDSSAAPADCPITGVYPLRSSSPRCPITMEMGCSESSEILLNDCNGTKAKLLCLGSWRDVGTMSDRVIISNSASYPRSANCYKHRVENGEIVIEIDETCNHYAPVPTSNPHPPFRLPLSSKKCKGASRVSAKPDYQTLADNQKNSSLNITSNITLSLLCILLLSISFRRNY